MVESKTSPPVSFFIPTSVFLVLLGWGGLYLLYRYTTPSGGTRWLFFFAGVLALTGAALPVMAFLNRRFHSIPPATQGVIVRQSLWFGIYFPILVWLQIGRVLNPFIALILAIGFVVIEWLLRLRERSKWKP